MKKIFTLIAAALLAVGANAQTITFDAYADGRGGATPLDGGGFVDNADDLTIASNDGVISILFDCGNKSKISSKSLTFALATATTADETEKFTYQFNPGGNIAKTTGERSITITLTKAGTLTIYPRSDSGSATDRTLTVQQNGTDLLTGALVSDADKVSISGKDYFKAYAVEVAAGTVNILTSASISFSAFKFKAAGGSESGGGETGENTTVASWSAGESSGTWTAIASVTGVDGTYTSKYNSNKTSVKCITFPNSLTYTEGTFANALKVEGEFKKGDVITIQPFTAMSANQFAGKIQDADKNWIDPSTDEEKAKVTYANIVLFDGEGNTIEDITKSLQGALTVTDGHEEAGDPKTFSYTLASDYSALYFGRRGNTRINLMKVEIVRSKEATAISEVKPAVKADGKYFNLSGQRVVNPGKGLYIVNGKKVVIK